MKEYHLIAPSVTNSVTLSNLQLILDPASSLGTFNNGDTIDLSGLQDSVKVLGFALTVNQDCTLRFNVFGNTQNISLVAGVERMVTIGDLILGEQISGGVNLEVFRIYYSSTNTNTLQGELIKNEELVGTLTMTLRFLS